MGCGSEVKGLREDIVDVEVGFGGYSGRANWVILRSFVRLRRLLNILGRWPYRIDYFRVCFFADTIATAIVRHINERKGKEFVVEKLAHPNSGTAVVVPSKAWARKGVRLFSNSVTTMMWSLARFERLNIPFTRFPGLREIPHHRFRKKRSGHRCGSTWIFVCVCPTNPR